MVRTVRAGRRRRRSPELAGRPPAGGGTAANRGGREDSPPVSLAGLRFFPAKMVRTVRKGASPEKFAGPRRTTAGERWPDISSAHGGGGRKKSPHMAFVAYEFSISSDSDDVSSSCNLPTPIIDSQFFVKNDPQQPKCLWRRTKFWEASPTHGPPTGSLLAWPKLLLA